MLKGGPHFLLVKLHIFTNFVLFFVFRWLARHLLDMYNFVASLGMVVVSTVKLAVQQWL